MNSRVAPELQGAFNRERRDASARKSVDAAAARTQTVHMYGRLAAPQREIIARSKVEVACERGCSYCRTSAWKSGRTTASCLRIMLRQSSVPSNVRAQSSASKENLKRIAALTPEQHIRAGIPCALLEEGICSVYEGRAATCRKYYSVSVETCRNAFDDTSAPLTGEIEHEQVCLAGNAAALGYAKGLEDARYDATLYELHYALHTALTNPMAETLYRSGKRPF